MTTATDNTSTIAQDEIISDDEVMILNAARTLAAELVKRARKLSYDDRVEERSVGSDTPSAFDFGMLVSHYEDIDAAVFQALNVTRCYGKVNLTDAQVHNHAQDAL
jgi:hypothetical protein